MLLVLVLQLLYRCAVLLSLSWPVLGLGGFHDAVVILLMPFFT